MQRQLCRLNTNTDENNLEIRLNLKLKPNEMFFFFIFSTRHMRSSTEEHRRGRVSARLHCERRVELEIQE